MTGSQIKPNTHTTSTDTMSALWTTSHRNTEEHSTPPSHDNNFGDTDIYVNSCPATESSGLSSPARNNDKSRSSHNHTDGHVRSAEDYDTLLTDTTKAKTDSTKAFDSKNNSTTGITTSRLSNFTMKSKITSTGTKSQHQTST